MVHAVFCLLSLLLVECGGNYRSYIAAVLVATEQVLAISVVLCSFGGMEEEKQ